MPPTPSSPHPPIRVSDYEISEQHFVNVAREFYGHAQFPAGNHDLAYLAFEDHSKTAGVTREDYRQLFLRALQSYKKPTQ